MIESIVVGVLVAGAGLFAARKLLRPARAKTKPGPAGTCLACDTCATAKGGDCPPGGAGTLTVILLLAGAAALAGSTARAADTIDCYPAGATDLPAHSEERITGGLMLGLITTVGPISN